MAACLCKGAGLMPVYKDEKTNTWYVKSRYKDWTGKNKHLMKRGFALKREAVDWEAAFFQRQDASLDMSVAASFGKHRFPGVGFGTGVSAMYVHSLTDRLVLAAGGFYDRLSWNGFNRNRFGINLMLGYKLTDRLSVYAYGSKAFSPGRGGWIPMPWADNFSSRFGGMLHFKLSDAASISLSVEEARWDR